MTDKPNCYIASHFIKSDLLESLLLNMLPLLNPVNKNVLHKLVAFMDFIASITAYMIK